MMGGRGPIPCKFGVQCQRQDCWYAHPDGRIIDAGGQAGVGLMGRGGMVRPVLGRPSFEVPAASPRMHPVMGAGGALGGSIGGLHAGGNECRYSFDCRRPDCHFKHPVGRAIDGDGVCGGVGSSYGRPGIHRAPSSSSICSLSRGMSEISFGSYAPSEATEDDQALRDTWFPQARDCSCCKGYMYGCVADICEAMGVCTCTIEEKDLDGGAAPIPQPRPGGDLSVPPHMGANGISGTYAQPGHKAPPQPPTEAALAAMDAAMAAPAYPVFPTAATRGWDHSGASAGGRMRGGETGRRNAWTGCRYGQPQGRNVDSDGVTFGDFGEAPTSGGSGRRSGARGGDAWGSGSRGRPKFIVDQDLMDTWYPDCRDCACCKGFKHGCKTPACAAAGICACPAVHTGQNGAKAPAPDVASTAATSSGDGGGDGGGVRTESQAKDGDSSVQAEVSATQGPASSSPSTGEASSGAAEAASAATVVVEGSGKGPAPAEAVGGTEGAAPTSIEDGANKTPGDGAALPETSSRESEDGTASASTATTAASEDAALST